MLQHLLIVRPDGTSQLLRYFTCKQWYTLCCGEMVDGGRAAGCGAKRDSSRISIPDRWIQSRFSPTNADPVTLAALIQLLERWGDGGREEWLKTYIQSCDIDGLIEQVDVSRCVPAPGDDVSAFRWRNEVIAAGKKEYALLLQVLLHGFDVLLMECLSQHPLAAKALCQPRNDGERAEQMVRAFKDRPENALVLLDVHERLLMLLMRDKDFLYVPKAITESNGIKNAILVRSA